ncbi:MAG: helix-turn-helix domain-containing protein, partial [Bacilli bacterium]|nr:helix-turn-helix domain-containing protein [Bacilli bacterium]
MNYDKIGEFIADNRKNKNFTQKELAKKLGVTDKAVSKWERGLGCPDVSILEVLAKELDVSVLEILKGRKIENEVINITEADDYIKESFKVSKDITKNNIFDMMSKVIFVLVLFISMLFTALSICNYINASKGEVIAIDDFYIEKNKEELERLKNNIELIKNARSI